VKVWGKRPHPQAVERERDGPQIPAIFTMFFKNNAFTAHFDLKLLLKNIFLNFCKVCWLVCTEYAVDSLFSFYRYILFIYFRPKVNNIISPKKSYATVKRIRNKVFTVTTIVLRTYFFQFH